MRGNTDSVGARILNMNLVSESIQNSIFLAKDAAYNDELYKLCFARLQCGQLVLLLTLTRDRYDLLPLARELNFSKELLKRFIIMYFPSIEGLTRKLLELWTLQPDLVIVDLGQPRPLPETLDETCTPPILQSLCLCIASLFSFMESLRRRRVQPKAGRRGAATACAMLASLVVLPAQNANFLADAQVQLLIDLYFYKNNAFDDFDKFKAKLVAGIESDQLS